MDSDGFYNVYVNSRFDYNSQKNAIRHELAHISRDDFYRGDIPLGQIETI